MPIFAHSGYQEKIQLPQVQISNTNPTNIYIMLLDFVSQSAEFIPCKQPTEEP